MKLMEPSLDDSVESNHGHVRVEQKVHESLGYAMIMLG